MAMKKKSLKTKGKGINEGSERLFLFLCLVCGLERLEIYPLPHNPICRTRNKKKKALEKVSYRENAGNHSIFSISYNVLYPKRNRNHHLYPMRNRNHHLYPIRNRKHHLYPIRNRNHHLNYNCDLHMH